MLHLWSACLQNFDAEISAVVAETVWDTPERQKYLSETIVEHLYRQGMLSVAEDLCQVNNYETIHKCKSSAIFIYVIIMRIT